MLPWRSVVPRTTMWTRCAGVCPANGKPAKKTTKTKTMSVRVGFFMSVLLVCKNFCRGQSVHLLFMDQPEFRSNDFNLLAIFKVGSAALNDYVSWPGDLRDIKIGSR